MMTHEEQEDEDERYEYRGFSHEHESEEDEPQYVTTKGHDDRFETFNNNTPLLGNSRNFAPQAFSSGFSNTSSSVAHTHTHSLGHMSNLKYQVRSREQQTMAEVQNELLERNKLLVNLNKASPQQHVRRPSVHKFNLASGKYKRQNNRSPNEENFVEDRVQPECKTKR